MLGKVNFHHVLGEHEIYNTSVRNNYIYTLVVVNNA